jgi:hypothetical protein
VSPIILIDLAFNLTTDEVSQIDIPGGLFYWAALRGRNAPANEDAQSVYGLYAIWSMATETSELLLISPLIYHFFRK